MALWETSPNTQAIAQKQTTSASAENKGQLSEKSEVDSAIVEEGGKIPSSGTPMTESAANQASNPAQSLATDAKPQLTSEQRLYQKAGGKDRWTKYKFIMQKLQERTRENLSPWDPPSNNRLGTGIKDAIWLLGVDRGWWQ